jgi:hypothetical protein
MNTLRLLILIASLSTLACGEDGYRNVGAYYYPYEDLEEGKVYIYRGLNEHTPPYDYWFFKSFRQGDTWFLTAQHYDGRYNVDQFQLQEMLPSGAYSDSYTLYEVDSSGKSQAIQTEVEFGNLFPFRVKDSLGVYLFKISWKDRLIPDKRTTLIRNRRYEKDTLVHTMGQSREGIWFRVAEVAEFDEEGILEVEMAGRELYVKDIGLTYLKKQINPDISLEYTLDTMVDMDYFLREISNTTQWQE